MGTSKTKLQRTSIPSTREYGNTPGSLDATEKNGISSSAMEHLSRQRFLAFNFLSFYQTSNLNFCRFSDTRMTQKYHTLQEVTSLAHMNARKNSARFLWIAVAVVLPHASQWAAALGCHPITICLSQLISLWPST